MKACCLPGPTPVLYILETRQMPKCSPQSDSNTFFLTVASNDRDGDVILGHLACCNSLFRPTKTLREGNLQVTGGFPHEWSVTWKVFQWHNAVTVYCCAQLSFTADVMTRPCPDFWVALGAHSLCVTGSSGWLLLLGPVEKQLFQSWVLYPYSHHGGILRVSFLHCFIIYAANPLGKPAPLLIDPTYETFMPTYCILIQIVGKTFWLTCKISLCTQTTSRTTDRKDLRILMG